jgi:hypothetical protein
MKNIVRSDQIDAELQPLAQYIYEKNKQEALAVKHLAAAIPEVPAEFLPCYADRPTKIQELTEMANFRFLNCEDSDELSLGLLGFFNISKKNYKKMLIVEYAQTGNKLCGNKLLRYGVGARMILKVSRASWFAKLHTPQQMTASVIFGRATVEYEIVTFGITGPALSAFAKPGVLHEDSYGNFIREMGTLMLDVYKNKSAYIITPQPLFL